MSIKGYGTCHNRGCYNDVEDASNYCSQNCERADAKKLAHDQQILLQKKALVKHRMYPPHGEPPECERPGCHNKVEWRSCAWKAYCSKKCVKLAQAFGHVTKE